MLIADQVGSRTADDRVPAALAALGDLAVTLPFERTAGDEIQGLLDDPRSVVTAVTRLTRLGGWRIGLGAGTVDSPRARRRPARPADPPTSRPAQRSTPPRTAPAELALALPTGVSGARLW